MRIRERAAAPDGDETGIALFWQNHVFLAIVPLSKLLGESDKNFFRDADVAKPTRVLVLYDFTDELRATLEEPHERRVNAVQAPLQGTGQERIISCNVTQQLPNETFLTRQVLMQDSPPIRTSEVLCPQ